MRLYKALNKIDDSGFKKKIKEIARQIIFYGKPFSYFLPSHREDRNSNSQKRIDEITMEWQQGISYRVGGSRIVSTIRETSVVFELLETTQIMTKRKVVMGQPLYNTRIRIKIPNFFPNSL
jgi:hypothetical protein